ncbi:MAG: PaaI family thioesterase [Gemmatimonadaceae bacterium]
MPVNDGFHPERVRKSFDKQRVMATIGAVLDAVTPGEVTISMPPNAALTQQHGYLQAGIIATIADSACGCAALSLMPEDAAVLSIEFKTNMLAPADGTRFIARGRVIKPGRTIMVCDATVHAVRDEGEKLVATMTGTMMVIKGRGISD